ncbi:MAG: DNA polymerase I [Clostridia bacterium]|nr:DNA polymerase I [Clostridia bacterium]
MKIMVIDGNSMVNRAFYGVRPLTNSAGLNTNAIYGFLTIYLKLLEDEKPDGVCIAFDMRSPTFRHKEYDGYKAQRKGMPEELAEQLPYLKRVLDAMNITRLECEGYEADDIIGTISRTCREAGSTCDIVTGDRDSFQLIANEGTNVLLVTSRMGKTETVRYDSAGVVEKYTLPPEMMIDLKALMGDASDNIPGVRGIGEKTAIDLIAKFGTIDEIYENLESLDIRDSVKAKLRDGKEDAYLSKYLATINQEVPIDVNLEEYRIKEYNVPELYTLFTELEFSKLIARLNLEKEQVAEEPIEGEIYTDTLSTLEKTLEGRECAVCISENLEGVGICVDRKPFAVLSASYGEDEYSSFIKHLFSNKVSKIAHDVKTLRVKLLEMGIDAEGFVFDVALGAYVISPTSKSFEIREVCEEYAPSLKAQPEVLSQEEAFSPLIGGDTGATALYEIAYGLSCVCSIMRDKIADLKMDKLYYEIELPLATVLADMQHVGMAASREELLDFGARLSTRIKELENEIFTLAGMEFNIQSPKQLGEVLFEKMGIPPVKKTKNGYSTNADVLAKLKDKYEIIAPILEYRQYTKLKSTYCDGLAKVISPRDGRIHSSFNQMVTATGRISSTEPNLQNIPVRTELGGEVRRMFVPRDGWVFVDADYSQIELRILAHISDDEVMKKAFIDNADIHTITASQVFGVSPDDVTQDMRRAAKAVNFGIVYGISEFSLAEDIGVSRYEAKRYIENYLANYSGVNAYMKDIVERAHRDGYVTTLLNRRRDIPEINAKNFNLRSFGERVALNAPIQGSAADIIKIAMIAVSKRLRDEGLKARLVLQVHDELIVEAPKDEAERVAEILTKEMESAYALSVPLIAEAAIGENWYDAKK